MQGERKLLRGHYNPVNWSRKYPNLQYTKIDGKRALVCTQCLRTINKPPHVRKPKAKKEAVAAEAK